MMVRILTVPPVVAFAAFVWWSAAAREPGAAASARKMDAAVRAGLPTRDQESGRLLFERYCVFCHGRDGDGFGINAPNLPVSVPVLRSRPLQAARHDDELAAMIARGGAAAGRSAYMPRWDLRLGPQDIDAIVAFLRTLPQRAEAAATDSR